MGFKINRVIWAIDIFESKEKQTKALDLLRAFVSKTNCAVDAVHVLNFAYVPPYPSNVPSWGEALEALAEKKMKELADSSEIANFKTKILTIDNAGSTRKNIDQLLDYVNEVKADAILVATHARVGMPRLLLGSFAETLLLKSTVPVLTLNPDADRKQKVTSILFPTYFTTHSHEAFVTVLALAKSLSANLILYYKEPLILTGSYIMPQSLYSYIEKEFEMRKQVSEKWRHEAEAAGVPTTVELDDNPGNPVLAIAEYAAAKKVDLIAMVTRSDAMSAILLGSSTRQVVRQAECPVFVLRESV